MSSQRRGITAGLPTNTGSFKATEHAESAVSLTEQTTADGPRGRRALSLLRDDPAFLEAMEAAEREVRVRNLNKGDWAREFGDDEYGIVKSVGLHTLRTDTWEDNDTDEGDHLVAAVDKETAARILDEHGVLSTRDVNTYAKRREAAIDVLDRWEATRYDQRSGIGSFELPGAIAGIWKSMKKADLTSESTWGRVDPSSIREAKALARTHFDFASMLRMGGYSDNLATPVVKATRDAIAATDKNYGFED